MHTFNQLKGKTITNIIVNTDSPHHSVTIQTKENIEYFLCPVTEDYKSYKLSFVHGFTEKLLNNPIIFSGIESIKGESVEKDGKVIYSEQINYHLLTEEGHAILEWIGLVKINDVEVE